MTGPSVDEAALAIEKSLDTFRDTLRFTQEQTGHIFYHDLAAELNALLDAVRGHERAVMATWIDRLLTEVDAYANDLDSDSYYKQAARVRALAAAVRDARLR